MFYSIGVDIAKDDFKSCILCYDPVEQTERVLATRTFANTPKATEKFVTWVTKRIAKKPAPLRCTLEATGVYYERIALHLYHQCPEWALSVVLPSQARNFNQSEGFKNKTDRIDARGLALMGARKKLTLWKGIKPFWSKLRQLTRTRSALIEQLTQLKNQLHAITHSGYTLADTLTIMEETIASLQGQVDKLEVLIREHLKSDPAIQHKLGHLNSIPSVGCLTIATILAETFGFEYFSSKSQLISYAGYDVKVRESGKYAGRPRLSKMGNARIRKAMYMPAGNILSRKTHPYYSYYSRLLDRHGIKMKAHVAVQKKLLACMYFIWKNNQAFDPTKALIAPAHKKTASHKGEAAVDTSTSPYEAVFFVTEN